MKNYAGFQTSSGIVTAPIRWSRSLAADYEAELNQYVADMTNAVIKWLRADYADATGITGDALPRSLADRFRNLSRSWQQTINRDADTMADRFVSRSLDETSRRMRNVIRGAIERPVTLPVTPRLAATTELLVAQNVQLIRSIPTEYFAELEKVIVESVTKDRDIQRLTQEIKGRYGVTQRRAETIAYDQTAKVNETLAIRRSLDLGVRRGIWLHSGASRQPRPSHLAANGNEFDLEQGMFLDNIWTHPGQLINCKCSFSMIVPLFGPE